MRAHIVLALAGLAFVAIPSDALACGGCFHQPPISGSPTVVTRHQMVVSLSATQTTLWDQIEYAGNPEDFVWVLPVRGGAPVELAENAFFEALDSSAHIVMQVPPLVTSCPSNCGSLFAGDSASFDPREGGVTVYHEAAIGPYETATIGSTDPDALVLWLRERGYMVPDSVLPVIRHYTDLGMDFAVLRLNGNAGVNQMQPVRVTTPGMNLSFPLRMIAAGVASSVGLELYVFAEGRIEPANFDAVEVDRDRLAYDWNTETFNYDALYDEARAPSDGRAWVTEFAGPAPASIQSYMSRDEVSGVTYFARDDYARATVSLPSPYLTRLTADLPARYLDEDLVLQAADGGDLASLIQVQREIDRPWEPTCPTTCGDPYASGSSDPLGWRSARGDGCSAGRGAPSRGPWLVIAIAGLALTLRRRRSTGRRSTRHRNES